MDDVGGTTALRDALLAHEAGSSLRHSLRNRLAAIRNATFFVKRRLGTGAVELLEAEPRIVRMLSLIEDELVAAESLLFAEPRIVEVLEAERGSCDATRAVRRALAELAPESGRVVTTIEENLEIAASERLLAIALASLIENALDAISSNGGTVTVTTDRVDEATVTITVSDDGDGFADEPVASGVAPFRSAKAGRLGVGLSLARRAALVWGGRLELARRDPRGTCATLFVPSATGIEVSS